MVFIFNEMYGEVVIQNCTRACFVFVSFCSNVVFVDAFDIVGNGEVVEVSILLVGLECFFEIVEFRLFFCGLCFCDIEEFFELDFFFFERIVLCLQCLVLRDKRASLPSLNCSVLVLSLLPF